MSQCKSKNDGKNFRNRPWEGRAGCGLVWIFHIVHPEWLDEVRVGIMRTRNDVEDSPTAKRARVRHEKKEQEDRERARRELLASIARAGAELTFTISEDSGGEGGGSVPPDSEAEDNAQNDHEEEHTRVIATPVSAEPKSQPGSTDAPIQTSGVQLNLSPQQKRKRHHWSEDDQVALVHSLISNRPWETNLNRAQRKRKWQMVLEDMQHRQSMPASLSMHGLRQRYTMIMAEFRETRREDENGTGSREGGQYSSLMSACYDLYELMEEDKLRAETKTNLQKTIRRKAESEGQLYRQYLTSGAPNLASNKRGPRPDAADDDDDITEEGCPEFRYSGSSQRRDGEPRRRSPSPFLQTTGGDAVERTRDLIRGLQSNLGADLPPRSDVASDRFLDFCREMFEMQRAQQKAHQEHTKQMFSLLVDNMRK